MRAFGIVVIVLAILAFTLPYFNNCEYDGKHITLANGSQAPMKCFWTSRAELAVAAPLFVVGAMAALGRRRESGQSLALVSGILGLSVMLLPTMLIGVCMDMTASCNLVMRPSMLFVGGATVLASAVVLALSGRRTGYRVGLNGAQP